ncbi:DUF3095 family protein [Neptuniibacter halophilus]|uniref:DUF3095 family protein n=1 Tax=Neptuniibacter halophilus TaxID=651666 RepID=UPI00257307E2|nr:DUF3095 family protein [Neptuniibacter halophilus]
MDQFYRNLPGFDDISALAQNQHYRAVPDEWLVAVLDVRESTQAIERGRYRDVNFIGAAAISTLLAQISRELPFVFGGDGACVLIRPEMADQATQLLASLCYYAQQQFSLRVHSGLVSVRELRQLGSDVLVAKYNSTHHFAQAMFKGGGLSLAEKRVKSDPALQIQAAPLLPRDQVFAGLTCRWKPIPASKGSTLCVLVQATGKDESAIIGQVLSELESGLGYPLSTCNPITMQQARYQSFFHNLRRHLRVSSHWFSKAFFSELYELLLTVLLFNLKGFRHFSAVDNYVRKIPRHCDFQKYDDTLRMVLDCSADEVEKITKALQPFAGRGEIAFGLHRSGAAQMTCYVESLSDGEHLHFVDGTGGGYAMAAKQLKRQQAKHSSKPEQAQAAG